MPGSRSYPKEARVRRRREFLALQRGGRKMHTEHFVVVAARRGEAFETRLGVTVSSKVGNAVVRNRVKRRVREVFRTMRPDLARGTDFVVIAKPTAATLSCCQVGAELQKVIGGR